MERILRKRGKVPMIDEKVISRILKMDSKGRFTLKLEDREFYKLEANKLYEITIKIPKKD
jgi:hypothetical protein